MVVAVTTDSEIEIELWICVLVLVVLQVHCSPQYRLNSEDLLNTIKLFGSINE